MAGRREGQIKFVHTPSNTEVEVEGVSTGDQLDEETVGNAVSIINFNAEEDNCKELSLGGNSRPSKVVVMRLQLLSKEIEDRLTVDSDIKRQDDRVIHDAVQEVKGNGGEGGTDGGEGTDGGGGNGDSVRSDESTGSPARAQLSPFNFGKIKDHLMGVFREMFSKEELLKSSPVKLLIDFALVTKYCFVFGKRLLSHAKDILRSLLPTTGFDIMCHVTSFLFQHLASIGWKSIINSVGGWAQLAGSLGLFGLLRVTKEKLDLGAPMLYLTVGVTSAAMGMLALYRFRNS